MAVSFYKTGDAADLAEQLTTILESPELMRSMGERNFAAGLQMTMPSVIRNYLRWFELNKYKRAIRNAGKLPGRRPVWLRSLFSRAGKTLQAGSFSQGPEGAGKGPRLEAASHGIDGPGGAVWRKAEAALDHTGSDHYQGSSALEGDF